MDSRLDSRGDTRYLHIAGAFGVGGRLTQANGSPIDLPIETVAAAHLPMVGGRSGSTAKNASVMLWKTTLLSVGAARSLAESDPAGPTGPFVSRTVSEVKNVTVAEGFSVKACALNMQSTHKMGDPFPSITFGTTTITGLKLGKSVLTVTIDVGPYNQLPTQAAFIAAAKKTPKQWPFSSFLTDPDGGLHRNESGYVIGSLVSKIEGKLPPGASIEDNGYIIDWPDFGKIILGEILIGPYVRRVTLIRLKHSDTEIDSGCSGGSTWP